MAGALALEHDLTGIVVADPVAVPDRPVVASGMGARPRTGAAMGVAMGLSIPGIAGSRS